MGRQHGFRPWSAALALIFTGCPEKTEVPGLNLNHEVAPASQPFGLVPVEDAPALTLTDVLCTDDGWCRQDRSAPVTRVTAGLAIGDTTWLVGGDEALLRWRGDQLQGLSLSNGAFMRTIAGDENEFFVAGGQSTVYRYDGTALRQISEATHHWSYLISGAYSPESGLLWAVARDDDDKGIVLEYNGREWWAHLHEEETGFSGIHGRSADDVWVVGDRGVIWHLEDGHWEFIRSGVENNLTGVLVLEDAVWIVGWGGLVLRYDGETIERIPCESEGVLYNIWQDAEGTIRVSEVNGVLGFDGEGFAFQHQDKKRLFVGGFVDAEGRNLILDESPTPLVERPEGDLAPLLPVSVVDFTDVIETGAGLVTSGAEASGWLHDGTSWTSLGVEAAFDEDERPTLRSVTEAVDGTLFFVGDDGAAVSGTSGAFVREDTGTDLGLRSVCASASGSVWAVGEAGIALEHLPSGEWLEVSGPWTGDLHAVHCADDGSIYVGGDTGVFVSSGSGFAAVDHTFASPVLAFAAIDDEVWALGRLGLVAIEGADGSWNELLPPTFEALHGAVRQGDDVVVVGRGGIALRYRGGVFTPETTGMRTNLNAVLALDGMVLAVGDSGVVLTSEP